LIREDQGHFTLQDRGSLDGTYLNGEKIRGAVTLQDGDEIGLGNTVLRFKIL
jgi:pSer/pThr/pTyr-binding forkhead associated (FHA) protein